MAALPKFFEGEILLPDGTRKLWRSYMMLREEGIDDIRQVMKAEGWTFVEAVFASYSATQLGPTMMVSFIRDP